MIGLPGCDRTPARPWKGAAFPAFALAGLDGATHDSREYLGRPLLINFWATWCPPCRREMAALDALDRRLAPRGLQLLAVSVDSDRNLVAEYLRREGLRLTVLIDADQAWSGTALQLPGFPTSYLVGRDGRIRDVWIGPRAWDEAPVQAAGAALINGSAVAYCVRKILNKQPLESNRALVSLDEKLIPGYDSASEKKKRDQAAQVFRKIFKL